MVQDTKTENGFWQVDLQEFVCGWGASFINISITYPMYKIMFRQVIKCTQSVDKFLKGECLLKRKNFAILRSAEKLFLNANSLLDAARRWDEISCPGATTWRFCVSVSRHFAAAGTTNGFIITYVRFIWWNQETSSQIRCKWICS